jgi:hypothetical protein
VTGSFGTLLLWSDFKEASNSSVLQCYQQKLTNISLTRFDRVWPCLTGLPAGGSRAGNYQALLQQHSRVPASALVQLLQQALSKMQAGGQVGAQVSRCRYRSSRMLRQRCIHHQQQ